MPIKKNGINSRLFLFVMMKLSFETLFSPLSTLYVFIRDKSAIMFSLFEFFLVIYCSISFRFLLMTLQPSDVSLSHTYLKFSVQPSIFYLSNGSSISCLETTYGYHVIDDVYLILLCLFLSNWINGDDKTEFSLFCFVFI